MRILCIVLFLFSAFSLFAAEKSSAKEETNNTAKYVKTEAQKDILTKEERAWLELHPIITLASTEDYPHLASRDEQGIIRGFDADLISQINQNLNINLTLKLFRGWDDAYESAKMGFVEGILSLSQTAERENIFYFSPVYHNDPTYIITSQEDHTIRSLQDFKSKIIATEKNSIINELILKDIPNAKLVHASNVQDVLQLIRSKRSHGALLEGMENYDLDSLGLKISGTIFTKSGEYTIGTHKKNPLLASIITKGINSISKNQMQAMKKKWFNKVSNTSLFSPEELNYIHNSPIIKVGVEDWPPIISTKDGKTIEGIVGELLTRVIQISGLKTELVAKKWNYLLEDFKENKIDILPATYYTEERAKFGLFSDAYTNINNVLYINKDNQYIKSFPDLEGKTLAIQKGFGTIDAIRKKFPKITIIETPTLQDAIIKVSNKEADALFEAQIVAQDYIQQLLITNLKPIYQNSIEENSLHFFSKKDNPILQSILNKALQSIPPQEKNNIIDKWLHQNIKRNINIAFAKDKEPYSSEQTLMKGIEYDIVKAVLAKSNLLTSYEKNLPQKEIQNALFEDQKLDAVVGIKSKNDSLYHSDVLISLQSIAVTRAEDNITLTSIEDLKDKNIIAFEGASVELDASFQLLFDGQKKSQLYREVTKIDEQINALLEKKTDVIIVDKNSFTWYLKKYYGDALENYTFHPIFHKLIQYEVAFKDKTLRDLFNQHLQVFKTTKEYTDIFHNYLYTDIESKTKIGTLVSSLVAKSIFKEDIKKLHDIIVMCATLPYIHKIEVFNNEGELLVSHIKSESQTPIRFDSFHSISNLPHKVGSIAMYFDDERLSKYTQDHAIIPHVSLFQHLSNYQDIKEVYKKLDFLDALSFSKKEEEFIRKHPIITFGATKSDPLYMFQKNKATGLYTDFTKIIEQKTGIIFKYILANTRDDLYTRFNHEEIQLIADAKDFDLPKGEHSLVSDEFINFKLIIASRNEGRFTKGLEELRGNVAVPRNSSSQAILMNYYPHIPLILTQTFNEALTLVSQGKATYCVGEEIEIAQLLQSEYPNLKVVGVSQERIPHVFLMHTQHPELLSIINKILDFITYEQQQSIKDQWFKTKINTEVDYSVLYKVASTLLFIILLGIIYNKRLQYLVDKKTLELEKLLTSFDKNVIAAKVNEQGKLIYASEALCHISGYSKEELQKNWKNLLANQTNKRILKELTNAFFQKKAWSGKLINGSRSGKIYWTETTLFQEYDEKGVFLNHTLISQDITAQKKVENLYKEIEDTQKEVIFKMGAIAEARSQETGAHVKRVAEYSKLLALAYGLGEDEANIIKLASPMHDIGKVAIADSILNKKGKLTPEEFTIMQTHAELGYDMLKNSHRAIMKAAAIIAYEHHEKFDGTGYPRQLQGEMIHIYGRITAIADVFDALGSKRVYKEAWEDEAIFDYFRKERGRHFDPKLIDLFFANMDKIQEIRRSFKDD